MKSNVTRDNHYVPIWHQQGFISADQKTLHYLNMKPDEIPLPNGTTKYHRALFQRYPSQCFYQTDLYSTFFGAHVVDEIEKRLFGNIDTRGAPAIEAFLGEDVSEWHQHFQDLFLYLDAQKLRTPKGLDWLRSKYPSLDQNALMMEMQGVRTISCTIWSECVREIVSARDARVKFILTDHPVTIYNHACSPDQELCHYPADPSISLKGSQTLFPLDQDQCLILTNLEYAEDPDNVDPLERRTFARQVRQSIVRTDKLIRQRALGDEEVIAINHVLKSRAKRFIAAGNKDWLWPEQSFGGNWQDIKEVLRPPEHELWHYGGETFVGYEDGSVHYQDAYGRTTPRLEILNKDIKEADLGVNDLCGCGTGKKYKNCCRGKPEKHRTSWTTASIRERNLGFFRGVNAILGTDSGKDWSDVRRELDEEKVKRIHELYGFLWPADTDIFELLPKPDGATRAVYSGLLDPRTTPFVVSSACLYFGEILVQNPFINPGQMNKKFSPVEHPHSYLIQTLKHLNLFFQLFPLIESGRINLFPDPSSVDPHLQRYAMDLAQARSTRDDVAERDTDILKRLMKQDFDHALCMLPKSAQRTLILRADPDAPNEYIEYFLNHLEQVREEDPLVLLREDVYGSGEDGGQFTNFQMVPNFELMLLIAQATGAFVVTDSQHRWGELLGARHRETGIVIPRMQKIADHVAASALPISEDLQVSFDMLQDGKLSSHKQWIKSLSKRLCGQGEIHDQDKVIGGFEKARADARREFASNASDGLTLNINICAPLGGIYHNNVQRLMVRCGIEDRPKSVALAVLMDFHEKK